MRTVGDRLATLFHKLRFYSFVRLGNIPAFSYHAGDLTGHFFRREILMTRDVPSSGLSGEKQLKLLKCAVSALDKIDGTSTPEGAEKAGALWDAYREFLAEYNLAIANWQPPVSENAARLRELVSQLAVYKPPPLVKFDRHLPRQIWLSLAILWRYKKAKIDDVEWIDWRTAWEVGGIRARDKKLIWPRPHKLASGL